MTGEQRRDIAEGRDRGLFQLLGRYETLSQQHDVGEASRQQQISNWDGIAFRLGAYYLTCRLDEVEEIIAYPACFPVPGTKDWLLGMANIRGNLAPVSDLGWYLFGTRTPVTARTRLIITLMGRRLAGLVVDEVFGQRHFNTDQLEHDDGWSSTELSGLVSHNFPGDEQDWGLFSIVELERRRDFMDGARQQ